MDCPGCETELATLRELMFYCKEEKVRHHTKLELLFPAIPVLENTVLLLVQGASQTPVTLIFRCSSIS